MDLSIIFGIGRIFTNIVCNISYAVVFLVGLAFALAALTVVSITYKLPIIGEIMAYVSTVI
jgi:hypothetical protein